MPQITITTDSDELEIRIFQLAKAYSDLTAVGLDAETNETFGTELSSALIDILVEETEENAPISVPEPPKDPAGYVIRSKRTLLAATRTIFASDAAAISHIRDNFARDVHVNYVVAPVYF